MTQRFNRLVTLTARSSETVYRLTRYHFATFSDHDLLYNDIDRAGVWTGFLAGGGIIPMPQTSSELTDLTGIRVTVRLSGPEAFPPVNPVADLLPDLGGYFDKNPNGRLLFLGPTDGQAISFKVGRVDPALIGGGDRTVVFYGIGLSDAQASGAPWTITNGAIDLAIDGLGAQTAASITTKRVWAGLSERSAAGGLIVGLSGVSDEGQVEEIEIRTRYVPALLLGESCVDDLGRTWAITSSRTEEERRTLIFDGFRVLATA